VNRAGAAAATLVAAACFGGTSALQHRAAGRQPLSGALHPRLLLALARDPIWLAAWVAEGGAIGLQALALRLAPVSFVQPLLVLGLPFAVVLRALLDRRAPTAVEVLGSATCAAAVGIFLTATDPSGGARAPGRPLLLVLAAAVVAAALVAAAAPRTAAREAVVALAAGVLLGIGGLLLRVVADGLGRLPAGELAAPAVLLVIAGGLGLMTTQAAFQRGELAVPLSILTLAEPLAAVSLAVPILGEHLDLGGGRLLLGGAAVIAAGAAVIGLARAESRRA